MKKQFIDINHQKYIEKINKDKRLVLICQLLLVIGFLGLWELAAYLKIIDVFVFSKPTLIYQLTVQYFSTGEIYKHINQSLLEVVLGLFFGTLIGIVLAIILWLSEKLQEILNPFLIVLNALPKTALAPIFIIWIGTGTKGIVFVACSISLIITIINALSGFNNVDKEQIKMMKSFNANRFQLLRYLILPCNFENIINIIKINIGMSWIGVIVGEFIVSRCGLGYLITYGTQIFRLDLVMMGVMILAVLTVLMNLIFDLLIKLIRLSIRFKNEREIR